jgi:Na+-translocating ferredoxin:NAD+ oxidoreductase RnfD subunit
MNPTLTRRRDALDVVWRFFRTPKGYLSIVFAPLLVIASMVIGADQAAPHVFSAVFGACFVEVLLVRRERGAWLVPTSALLSGLIVAFVLGPFLPWALTAVIGAAATASKHLVRTRRGHIFNPAAFALFLSILIFATGESWWGALPDLPAPAVLLLIAGGAFVAERTYKVPLILTFLACYFGLFTIAGVTDAGRVAEMFRSPFVNSALFLAFFMLTDPPTSPGRIEEQIWFGVLVALVSVGAQLAGFGQSFLLVGLLAGNAELATHRWLAQLEQKRRSDLTQPSTEREVVSSRRN